MSRDPPSNERYAYIKESPTAGRGLFASKDVPAGEPIFSLARPLICAVDTKHLTDTCSNCFASSVSPIGRDEEKFEVKACTGCKMLRYCSKKCQSQSWKRHHKFECESFRVYNAIEHQTSSTSRAYNHITAMRRLGTISEDEFSAFKRLESHLDGIRSIPMSAGHRKAFEQIEALAAGPWDLLWVDAFGPHPQQQLYGKIWTNSLTLVTPTFEPLGLCLDPFAASANHSCDPNAFVVMDGPVLSFRTLKPISKDEEIFISYIDNTNPFARRQQELKERWFFTCACSKCQRGPTGVEDEWKKPAWAMPKKWQRCADDLIKDNHEISHEPTSYVGPDLASHRLAAVQAWAFNHLEEAQEQAAEASYREAINTLENGMRVCYQSEMWPLTRQPYPALRHELFVNMLTVGTLFSVAWGQAAKTYSLIDPVLYPQPHHPLRVVHCWAFAKLTLYLAAERDSYRVSEMERCGVDLPVVAYGLLKEVMRNVPMSHGRGSEFMREVTRKVMEVTADMMRADPQALRMAEERLEEQWVVLRRAADWLQY